MPKRQPLITASGVTALVAVVVLLFSGGHSPFAPHANAAAGAQSQLPVLADPGEALVDISASDPIRESEATEGPMTVVVPATPRPTARSTGGAAPAPTPSRRPAPTAAPTRQPTAAPVTPPPAPTPTPTQAPTPRPTRSPAPTSAVLSVSLVNGQPLLSWGVCSSSSFAAYAVVRSLDSEIHYPPESNDTLVAMITSAATTQVSDTKAPTGRLYYRVWCLWNEGGEYQTISRTSIVSATVP